MRYEIKYSSNAVKFIKKIKEKKLKDKIREAIFAISENPYCGEAKIGDLQGIFSYDVYYNRINYEIAYTIEDDIIIIVIMIGTRENFYKELKRYI